MAGGSGSSTLASPEVVGQGKVLERDASVGGERDAQPSAGRERAQGHRDLNEAPPEHEAFVVSLCICRPQKRQDFGA